MSKVSKFTIIGLIILLGVNTVVFTMVYKESEEKYNTLQSRYQMKNDSGFLYILKNIDSVIPLAETLEAISNTAKDESPTKVVQLIETAKKEVAHMDEQLQALIEFSDDYSENGSPEIVVNHTVMNTEEQFNIYLSADSGIWWVIRSISYDYWKSSPKIINDKAREHLRLLADELRSMEKTLDILKENHTSSINSIYAVELAKPHVVGQLEPHFKKLNKLNENLNEKLDRKLNEELHSNSGDK